ncbi:hypothetical protein B6N60_00145 [Richelia sinica FACHB-800]|uniref:Uncharacterized protein n=1 Tax=Richelia sinica FACHB-800 TaxID=1357546 RepID=A0A975T3C3_9NOST|nr:hypothetical protein [Richelia sinica]MBD2665260.1 hypothetical protein [Richelia sinica FACHB-800]QXE21471.1 hypothetical protein B6N60_00145 [Richelia sinica FACHB-800]
MSSGSSSRYQSKLFNFVYQQSRRLTQQWESGFRNLQVAAKWSVEALLYPLYKILQPDESVGKGLKSSTAATKPQLQLEAPATDTPIQNILEVVEHLPSPAVVETSSPSHNPLTVLGSWWSKITRKQPQIDSQLTHSLPTEDSLQHHIPKVQGIASQLENRHLVLVTTDNRILDVLTPQQQHKLADRINSEITEYKYSLQLIAEAKQQELLPKIDNILNKLTGQNQENQTALPSSSAIEDSSPLSFFKFGRILAFFDTVVANLESQALVPVQNQGQGIIKTAQTQLNIFLYGKEYVEARGEITVNSDKVEHQQLNISELIAAAINYFFGDRDRKRIQTEVKNLQSSFTPVPGKRQILPDNHQFVAENIEDPWLSWDDLFGEVTENAIEREVDNSPNVSDEEFLQEPSAATSNPSINDKQLEGSKKMQVGEQSGFEAKPDWIEISATLLGYEKHPLEQILAWLDRAMLWVEAMLRNIFYFFKGLMGFN